MRNRHSSSRRSQRGLAVALVMLVAPALTLPVMGQEAPPPVTKEKPKPKAPPKPRGGNSQPAAPAGPAAPAPPTLLIDSDMNATVVIDGDKSYRVKANEIHRIQVPVGEHLLKATSDDGKRQLEQVVKASGSGTMVVQLKLSTAVAASNPEEFDRHAARVWLGLSDLVVAGQYAGTILNKSFGFHDKTLSTAVYTAQQFLKRELEEFKKFTPSDPGRVRIANELLRAAAEGDKYVELIAQSISAAQQANSWYGQPLQLYSQAKAMEQNLLPVPTVVEEMKKSSALVTAVPVDRRPRMGLARDPKDFDLGVQYYESTPQMLAVVTKGGMADGMGFKPGDKLLSAAGRPVGSVWDFKQIMKANAGRKISVVLERGGKQETKDVSVPAALPN